MDVSTWMYLFAASGLLTLAILSLSRGAQSAIARPLALGCLALFGLNFASLADRVAPAMAWGVLDDVFSALSPPLVLHLVVTFVGASRTRKGVVVAGYVAFGLLAFSSALGLFLPWARVWSRSSAWAVVFLVGWIPILAFICGLLIRHLLRASDPDEKARTRTFLAALTLGGTLGAVDVLDRSLNLGIPRIASIGTLLAAFLVAASAFRFRLFDRDLSVSTALYALTLSTAGVVAYVVVWRLVGGNAAALAFGTLTVTLALGAAAREVASSRATQHERMERLAVLGRFSSQMAHDLKNPLAALKGALQFLKEERAQGRSLDAQHEFVQVMLDQVDRLHRVVDDYQRIGRVEPVKRAVDVNALVRAVVALEPFVASGVSIAVELAQDLPSCELDADLISGALENLIRNALEAMPGGGRITVKTERAPQGALPEGVALSVADGGVGMDARRAERAFDDFYTTKPTGSGLGLAFVRRVALAHRGEASLSSRVGTGTEVRLRLPTR